MAASPPPDPHAARVRELEERLRQLQAENEQLAEGQADAFLLGLLSDHLQREEDPDAILGTGLERMSVLKDVPFCAVCVEDEERLHVRRSFLGFSHETADGAVLSPSARVLASLPHGIILTGAGCADAGLPREGALAGFAPTAVLFLPFRSRVLPRSVVVFADDAPGSRLPTAGPTLQRAAETVLVRLENVALLAELRALNAALDEKVAARTHALGASEERARLALEAVAGSAWDWDLASAEVVWSDGVAGLLGLAPGALAPSLAPYLDRVHPEDRTAVATALERVRAGNAAPERVVHRVDPDGEGPTRWLELHVRAAQAPHGAPTRAAGVVLDVTERHRLEEELRQAQKMETVGRLAGGVAHDFNNLLTTILGVSEMLLGGLAAGDPLYEDLASIRDAGRRAALLTRQLLAFSRKQRLEMRSLQLDDVVRGFAPMLSRLIGEDVAVRLDLAVGLPPVLADPSQVEQILMNLAVNARDAMPGGGTLTIGLAPARAEGGGTRTAELVRLRVSDTGAGMPPEVAARVFEPFFTTKPRGQGTGLGLATVYGIVTQHGGSVTFDTAPGKGTRFDVLLPVAPAGAVAAPAPPAGARAARPEGGGRGETVLVVDDEPLVRRAICRALKLRGYDVVEAASGEEALGTVSGRPGRIDLLLTDVVMPGMRGPDLVREFTRRCPGRPALLMSGYPEASAGQAPLAGGYLEKPIDPEALARAVRAALDAAADPARPLHAG